MGSGMYGRVGNERSTSTKQGYRAMSASVNSNEVQLTLEVKRHGISTDDGTLTFALWGQRLGAGWQPKGDPMLIAAGKLEVDDDYTVRLDER